MADPWDDPSSNPPEDRQATAPAAISTESFLQSIYDAINAPEQPLEPEVQDSQMSGASSSFSVRNSRNRPYIDSPYGSTGSLDASTPGSIPSPLSRDHMSPSGFPPVSAPASRASGSGSITSSKARAKARGVRWDQSGLIASVAAIFIRIRLEPGGGGLFHQQKRVFKGSDLLTSAAEAYGLYIGTNDNKIHPWTLDDPTLYKIINAGGAGFRKRMSSAISEHFSRYYSWIPPPESGLVEGTAEHTRYMVEKLTALKTSLAFCHSDQPDPDTYTLFSHRGLRWGLGDFLFTDPSLGPSNLEYYHRTGMLNGLISTYGAGIVHHVDVLLSALRGGEAPEFGEGYAAHSDYICVQLEKLLVHPVHGKPFKEYLMRWTNEAYNRIHPSALPTKPGPQVTEFSFIDLSTVPPYESVTGPIAGPSFSHK